MKVIHFLQNNCDLTAFADYIEACNFVLKKSVNMPLEYESQRCLTCYITDSAGSVLTNESNENEKVKFCTSYQIDSYWQLGRVVLFEPSSEHDLSIYQTITKHIKKHYLLSGDKQFYIGPGMYEDWLNYKVNYLSPFFYQKIVIPASGFDFDHFRKHVTERGYTLKGDGLDIRHPLDESIADGYVIFSDECNMYTRVVARKEYYTCNSQCAFLHKNRKGYTFIADNRLLFPPFMPVYNLWDQIKIYFSTKK